jgi:lysylphosphatidylglycerol synthetase-like protein (DUF2156 family)
VNSRVDLDLRSQFDIEVSQHLAVIEPLLLTADFAALARPEIDLLFRGFHSIKGLARVLNAKGMEAVAHEAESLLSQVRAISEQWVGDKGLPEMGFTLGGVDEALGPDTMVGLAVDADLTVHGVTSWLPVYSAGGEVRGWTLDVMRRLPDGFKPVTEFLIASACLSFREQGASLVSLSGAPLAHSGDGSHQY